jgi:hypothetical protein
MAIANDSKEHSRSDRRELVKEIFANNNDIPD